MTKFTKSLIMVIGIVFALSLLSLRTFAAESDALSVMAISPMYHKIVLSPGESKELSIKIANLGGAQQDLQYSVSVGSFSQNGDEINTEDVTQYNQIANWIVLEKESGSIVPNGAETLKFRIDVPESAPAGGQYATILVQDDTSKNMSGGSNVNIESVAQITSIIYAEITGERTGTGVVIENNLPSFIFNNKLEATSLVKNTGNVHTDAKYTLQVWPLFSDEEICTNEEKPGSNLIMPDMERSYTQSCDLPIVGVFRAKQEVRIFDEVSSMEKIVIVCPLWLLSIIVIIIFALAIWLVMRFKKRNFEKMEEN